MALRNQIPGTGSVTGDKAGSARGGPPAPPPPPPATKAQQSSQAVFVAYVKKHPNVRPYAQLISKWAAVYKVDPTYLAALIGFESGGDPNAQSSADALGLAQIHMPTWAGTQTPWGETISREWATNPNNGVRFAAWYLSRNLQKYGSYDAAYKQGYNPGYKGAGPFGSVPKAYVPTGKGLSPTESASVSAETAAATDAANALFDRWAVIGKDGKVKFTRITDPGKPPANVLKYGPTPLTQSQFLQVWKQTYQDTFFAYTGRQAAGKEIANILKRAPSVYTLANTLAKSKDFTRSPTYKAHAPGIVEIAKQVYGGNWKADKQLVARAIAEDWDQATLQANLRARPEYLQGPEFQDSVTKFSTVYQQIYGRPDPNALTVIGETVLQGWTPDQFAAYLRAQPNYKFSPEYQTKALQLGSALGMITGQQPTVKETVPFATVRGTLPDSPRIPGAPVGPKPEVPLTGGVYA